MRSPSTADTGSVSPSSAWRNDGALSAGRAVRARHVGRRRGEPRLLGDLWQSAWQAGRRGAWWPRFRLHGLATPAVRSGCLSCGALRSKRLRAKRVSRERPRHGPAEQHHVAPRRRHGGVALAPASGNRAVAGARRLVGQHPGSDLRRTLPDRVAELILFGVTTGRHEEFDWLFRGGLARFFPEQWSVCGPRHRSPRRIAMSSMRTTGCSVIRTPPCTSELHSSGACGSRRRLHGRPPETVGAV